MACVKLNRAYYGIEIEPLYIQETIKRYLDHTLKSDIYIIRDGKKIDFNEFKEFVQKRQISLFEFF